jgi:hypothetical protein
VERVHTRGGSPRAIAQYLMHVRPVVAHVSHSRQGWVRDIGVLMEDARHQTPFVVAQAAGRIGRTQDATFREALSGIERMAAPGPCGELRAALVSWLEKQRGACEVMIAASVVGEPRRLNEVQPYLAEARHHARRFNEEYARLAGEVRRAVAAAPRRRAAGGDSRRSAAR